jgi:hypothetical protein
MIEILFNKFALQFGEFQSTVHPVSELQKLTSQIFPSGSCRKWRKDLGNQPRQAVSWFYGLSLPFALCCKSWNSSVKTEWQCSVKPSSWSLHCKYFLSLIAYDFMYSWFLLVNISRVRVTSLLLRLEHSFVLVFLIVNENFQNSTILFYFIYLFLFYNYLYVHSNSCMINICCRPKDRKFTVIHECVP